MTTPIRLDQLAHGIGARLLGDGDIEIVGVTTVQLATSGQLAMVGHAHDRQSLLAGRCLASAVIVDEGFAANHAHQIDIALLCGDDTAGLLRQAMELLLPPRSNTTGIHGSAIIGAATIHPSAIIGAGCVIGDDVIIGDHTRVGPRTVIGNGVHIGERCVIGPGCVLGDDGFVFAPRGSHNDSVRSAASVIIDDDVDVGANVCIDRGLLRDTRIGAGTRIDNLVQVAHDVVIGMDCVIAAQVGIAGFVTLGDGVVMGGQAGINPHVVVAAGVRIGGKAGVTNDIHDEGAAVAGMPALPHLTWLKAMAHLRRLGAQHRNRNRNRKRDVPPRA